MLYIVYTDMATLQKRKSRGHTYWSIVESRRVNGKPRPVIVAYLGRAEDLLKRLTEGLPHKAKSYQHGAVATFLEIAEEYHIVQTINRHVPHRQLRDDLTVGGSLLLAAIGRICRPTSKRHWYPGWARKTSLSYLLRKSLVKLDSQHFWDQMDALPVESIPAIEDELISKLIEKKEITLDTLLCDTTNFFTYIDTANHRTELAQRGHNKQKRMDLRQLGLLLLISRREQMPLFHKIYQGNLVDRTIFAKQFKTMIHRFKRLTGSLESITLVFDQGNNSKKMLSEVDDTIHFVGSLSPSHHKELIAQANPLLAPITVNGKEIQSYRTRTLIWDLDLTAVVYISPKLHQGQIRGTEQSLSKQFKALAELKDKLARPTQRGRKRTREGIEKKVKTLTSHQLPAGLVRWHLEPLKKDAYDLAFWIDEEQFTYLKEQWFGRRILITNRHHWSTEEIIQAYWGQTHVEKAFKLMKNPWHAALRPQYHWTDQKIEVHGFICILALLLLMMAYNRAKQKVSYKHSPQAMIDTLSSIRMSTYIEQVPEKRKGRYKVYHRLEDLEPDEQELADAFGLSDEKLKMKLNIPFSVYK